MPPAPATGPLAGYQALIDAGRIAPDPAQGATVGRLQALHQRLDGYRLPGGGGAAGGALQFLFGSKAAAEPAPKGLYIWGDVGRGKSMLMDLFFEQSGVELRRRVHFHAFMQEVHATLHEWRQRSKDREAQPQPTGGSFVRRTGQSDVIPPLAKKLAAKSALLCLDELQVTDVADAMLVGRLFQHLFEQGVVVVCTSNRPPIDLYKDGLNRQLFVPFIELIGQKLEVIKLEGAQDYRLKFLRSRPVYWSPLDQAAAGGLAVAFRELTGGATPESVELEVKGRKLKIPAAAKGVAQISFAEACEQPLGPADFIELARSFHSLILAGVPKLGPDKRNEAKRFVTLIDELYEHKVKLVMSAAVPALELYTDGDGAFEFERTVSRLMEMQGDEYLHKPHLS